MSAHYKNFPPEFEPYKVIAFTNFNFNEGNIWKYVCRYPYKGTPLQDLEKALEYTRFAKERPSDPYSLDMCYYFLGYLLDIESIFLASVYFYLSRGKIDSVINIIEKEILKLNTLTNDKQ
jgi:hypothetical protein